MMKMEFMNRAFELAKKGEGFVSPNPCVGAVIVQSGKIVAEGYHKRAGLDHAEIVAIKSWIKKGPLKSGAELYVSLEPCCHHGKTAPCVDAIIDAGFKTVYIGMKDPFDKVNGRGIKTLRAAGIKVELLKAESDLARDLRDLNQVFLKSVVSDFPYITLKAGMSLDGKIATSKGQSQWITSEDAREDGRLERSKCDAVLVGSGTVSADNCELAAHGKWSKKNILRVILDSGLNLSPKSKVFRDENVFVACSKNALELNRQKFAKAGIVFKDFGVDKVNLKSLLKYLKTNYGVQSVFVEGGAKVHGAFYDEGLVDRVLFYIAPKLIGGSDCLSVLAGKGVASLKDALAVCDYELSIVDIDIKFDGKLRLY